LLNENVGWEGGRGLWKIKYFSNYTHETRDWLDILQHSPAA